MVENESRGDSAQNDPIEGESPAAAPKRTRATRAPKAAAEKAAKAPKAAKAEKAPRAASAKSAPKSAADHVGASASASGPADAPASQAADETPAPKRRRSAKAAPKSAAQAAAGEAATEPPAAAPPAPTGLSPLFQAPPVPPPAAAATTPARGQERAQDDDEGDEGSGGSRRRRRRRGGGGGEAAEAKPASSSGGSGGSGRQRSRREPEPITEPQKVKGSTRLEAKKQRRRDGREAGRRRPVVTEAEFLARRESVDRVMVVRSKFGRIQIGVLEDGVLVEHYVARSQDASLIGNVYLGKVQNVLPSMEAAFVDIGRGRNAVLYSGEVDWEAAAAQAEAEGRDLKNQGRKIELALKSGDRVLVQVTKDPVGHKGARLTSQISLPGRYLVYVPGGSMNGISRKLPDTERARLKKILKEVLPDDAGVIVRTAAEGATEEQLTRDVTRLTKQWEAIQKDVEAGNAPKLLHSEPDLLVKIVRDVFNEDFHKLVVSGDDALSTIADYLGAVAPDLMDRLERYEGEKDAFDEFRIAEQIDKALERKVWLPSGGSLIIDRTEAMTVIDVNTGKFVGSGGNLEETVTKNNLEAAEEIVRQLRLRDIGGIIVVDFIDMVLESNRDLVLRRLVECLSRDRTKHQVAEVTSLGLVQMTRKKLGLGLIESFSEPCEVCAGRGIIVHHEPVAKHRGESGGGGSAGGNGSAGSGSSRRRRGASSGSGSSGGVKNGVGSTGTHAITDDVRNALAQVAAKTVHHDAPAEDGEGHVAARAVEAAAQAAVQILDIPIAAGSASSRRLAPAEAEEILGSVLQALPEATTPAPRARRSRRASSSGGPGSGDAAATDGGAEAGGSD
ncbi:MAG: ribonuclease E/G [Actinomycetales bacterium]|nr:ribonuclease E/G [Actinomycetales bacterium]